jgi:hypothetical protein
MLFHIFWRSLYKSFVHLHICTFNPFFPCKSNTYRMYKNFFPAITFCTLEHLQLPQFFYICLYTFAQTNPHAPSENVQMFQCTNTINPICVKYFECVNVQKYLSNILRCCLIYGILAFGGKFFISHALFNNQAVQKPSRFELNPV